MKKIKEIKPLSRERFEEWIDLPLRRFEPSHNRFTYIAKSKDQESVYKIGHSKNPLKRVTQFPPSYRALHLEMVYFLEGELEHALLTAVTCAGAVSPLPNYSGRREAYYIKDEDVDYIVKRCGFRPISEFDKDVFDKLSEEELIAFCDKMINQITITP